MITFLLKHPTSTTPTLILMADHFDSRVLRMSTGQFIRPAEWNFVKRRPKANGSSALTTLLDRLADRVRELHIKLEADGQVVTPASLRAAYDRDVRTGGKRENLQEFVARHPGGVNDSLLRLIKLYPYADFADISTSWIAQFHSWLAPDYKPSYIAGIISALQRNMKLAGSAGLHRNNDYQYRKPTGDSDSIYLTESELTAIRKVKLSERLDRIRDRFIIGCYTGLRFSDNVALTADSIRNGMIFNRNIKTGTDVVIPLHPVVTELIDKYDGCLPPAISCQNTNKQIKLIAKAAGISKWEKVCTHVSRRSFATNLALAGVPLTAIRKMTGHASEVNLNKYLRMSAEESALSVASHPFFQ